MIDYFGLYKTILTTIRDHHPDDAQELYKFLTNDEYIKNEIENKNPMLSQDILDILDNLIDDGLVKGTRKETKTFILYMLSGLTSTGQSYLLQTADDNFSDRLKNYLKENGLPLTPQNITKFIARLAF